MGLGQVCGSLVPGLVCSPGTACHVHAAQSQGLGTREAVPLPGCGSVGLEVRFSREYTQTLIYEGARTCKTVFACTLSKIFFGLVGSGSDGDLQSELFQSFDQVRCGLGGIASIKVVFS